MFVLNSEGRYELKGTDYDIPQVSFNDVDDQEVADYVEETEQRYVENDEKWTDSWQEYQDASAQPWNNFLDSVESNSQERDSIDVDVATDILVFVAENTYVDGQSLASKYSVEIDDVL